MNHFASPSFWENFNKLQPMIQKLAEKNFQLLKENPNHPSLHFKKVLIYYSVRVGIRHRALAVEIDEGLLWFWIGTHSEYDDLIKQLYAINHAIKLQPIPGTINLTSISGGLITSYNPFRIKLTPLNSKSIGRSTIPAFIGFSII